jgi:hypothetical protein
MLPNPAVITPKVLVPATVSSDNGNVDQRLANTHRDMAAQAINPSALRKAHDTWAQDDNARLPLSQLSQYLLTEESVSIKGKSADYVASLEFLERTVKLAYEKSSCFRRLFNHAWADRLNNHHTRLSVAIGNTGQPALATALVLPDVLKRGQKPKYASAIGLSRLSNERAFLNLTVKALTQLPEHEPGHPRGPNPEYVNIILKEMGVHDSAQTDITVEQSQSQRKHQGAGSLALTQLMQRIGNNAETSSFSKTLRDQARAYLMTMANEHLALIEARGIPENHYLMQISAEEKKAAKQLPDVLMRLFHNVQGDESPMEILENLHAQNTKQNMFTYEINKFRTPVQMVAHRDGDCESFCNLFQLLGSAAQIKNMTQKHMEGEMRIRRPDQFADSVAGVRGESLLMARHSILQLDDGEHRQYFDPVFGQQVDPHYYGRDPDRYLLKGQSQP